MRVGQPCSISRVACLIFPVLSVGVLHSWQRLGFAGWKVQPLASVLPVAGTLSGLGDLLVRIFSPLSGEAFVRTAICFSWMPLVAVVRLN